MRRLTSLILFFAFLVVTATGLQLDFEHQTKHYEKPPVLQGSIKETGSGALSIIESEKPFYPKEAHKWSGYLFIAAGLIHVVLNIKAMKRYFNIKC